MSYRFSRARVSLKSRRIALTVDRLEVREVLSTTAASGFVAQPMFDLGSLVANSAPPAGAYTPTQIQQAYGFNQINFGSVHGDGTGQTIAIVDAYDDPNIQADLNAFCAQFGLPTTTVTRVNENGGSALPSTDSSGGWELEEALDVEWAHAIAPGARIVLVEASSTSDADLLPAVSYAASHANVVSLSWGGGEFSSEANYDSDFNHPGVAFVASSGDSGAPISWPAASPNVLAVGGTSLYLGSGNTYASEAGWNGSGGGPSAYESQPAYQHGVATQTSMRANPDVAYNASPNTGFAVYDSFNYSGTSYGWIQLGGTSAGAPQWAALLAIADQGRSLNGLSPLNGSNPQGVLTTLYQNASSGIFHDVTSGTSTGNPNYSAGSGYDYVTGMGSPLANLVVNTLVGTTTSTPPVSPDSLSISAPSGVSAGSTFSVTVTASNTSGSADSGYTGTVRFSSTDTQAGLPSTYTFSAADHGVHTFLVTLKTAGAQSVSVTDTASNQSASASGISVSPGAVSQFIVSGLPSSATVGASQTFTVSAKDAYGNVATNYTGTVRFSSSDPGASLPGSYTYTASDAGTHTFRVSFGTAGTQSVSVSDASTGLSASQGGVVVSPAAPVNLSVSAASTSQINLSWTGSTGATGYSIERSSNGGTSWTVIASTGAGTTSYQNTGLASGTSYAYRVRATGGHGSAYSNTASATTSGTAAPAPTDSLWSSTYTPSENAYAYGSYEVGMKFSTDVAGTVSGVKFYKQTWMDGYNHVGHLWSSNGTLLATVTFTSETAYGWQQASFSNPVTLTPGATYEVSFSTGGGYFGITTNGFNSSGYSNGPLHALPNSLYSGNGVYGSSGSFPMTSGNGMNFWVDVLFSPSSTPAVTPSASTQTSPVVTFSADAEWTTNRSSTPASSTVSVPSSNSAASSSWTSTGTVAQTTGYSWSNRNHFG